MRTMILAAASVLILASSASAQMFSNAPGQFCLRSGASDSNKGMETCNFQSMAECNATKSAGDQCVPNASLRGAASTTGLAAAESGAAPRQMKSTHASSKHAMKGTSSKHAMKSTNKPASASGKSTTGSAPKQ